MRVLIVKLSSFGDVIHTFPAVSDLAAAIPGVEIDWVADESLASFARLHPAVSEVHGLALRGLRWPPGRWTALAGGIAGLRRHLKARRYDRVVDLQGLMKSALVSRLAGVPVSGYDRDSAREPAATRLYRHRFSVPRTGIHAIERTRRLLAAAVGYTVPAGIGAFGLTVPPRPTVSGLPSRYALVVHSSSWPSKQWPEEHWHRLLPGLTIGGRSLVLAWGDATEHDRAKRLAEGVPSAFVLPARLAGADLAGLIGHAEFAVGVDSGMMHFASALGVPSVWLFGPTDPGKIGPYGANQIVVRSAYPEAPCMRRACDHEPGGLCCMRAIAVESVAEAIARLGAAATVS